MNERVRAVDPRERAVVDLWRKGRLRRGTIINYLYWVRRFRKYREQRGLVETEQLTVSGLARFLTQFGRMCQKLGIRIIAASTPQAKGRVERVHGVHQDRLIKKLRRKEIASYEGANQYLQEEYLPEHNRRFRRAAAKAEDYHGRRPSERELREIFRLETERVISNDWVIRHGGRWWQLQPGQRRYGPTKSKALVCEWEDGTMEVHYRGERIRFWEVKEPPRTMPVPLRRAAAIARSKPKPDHPWRQGYQNLRSGAAATINPARLAGIRPSASP